MPRNKKNYDDPEFHAGTAVAFVTSLDRDTSLLAHVDAVGTTCVVDNGASCHCYAIRSDFVNLVTFSMGTVNGIDCEVEGLGDVVINVSNTKGNCVSITLKDVLFVPALEQRSRGAYLKLVRVRRATHASCHCNFSRDEDNTVLRT